MQGSRYDDEFSTSAYPVLRGALDRRLDRLRDEDIEALFERYNLSAGEMEGFFDTLKDIGQAVVKAAPAVLPVAGGVLGTVFGGPVGGALGSALGQAAGSAIGSASGAPPPPPPPRAAPRAPAPAAPARVQPAPPAPPGAAAAAGPLINAMFDPQTIQALIQMLLGQLGRQSVDVAGRQVPNAGFTNMLSVLANQAQAEYAAGNRAPYEEAPEYWQDEAGQPIGDPANAEHRARILYEMLQEDGESFDDGGPFVREHGDAGRRGYEEAGDEEAAFYEQLEMAALFAGQGL